MAKGPEYRVQFRRRRIGKTNYYLRRKLLTSKKTRFVVRKSSKHLIAQLVQPKLEGDKAIVTVHTKELQSKYGWKGGTGNSSAAYLAGYLAGKRALSKGVKEAILDIGLAAPTNGSRLFAALKGALKSGLIVPASEDILPSNDRVKGAHIIKYDEQLSKNPSKTNRQQFSKIRSGGLDLKQLADHFDDVLKNIDAEAVQKKAPKARSGKVTKKSKGS